MRTALLVYSGITVKLMVDSDLDAQLSTMFMVQYDPDGVAGAHDHPFEETYYFLEGHAEATFDGETGTSSAPATSPGPASGVCTASATRRRAAALAGDPGAAAAEPARLPVRARLGLPAGGDSDDDALLVVGGTHGIGLEIARRYAAQGWSVSLTGRDGARAEAVAAEVGGDARGIALDLSEPERSQDALADVGEVDHVVLAAIERDTNTLRTTTSPRRGTS